MKDYDFDLNTISSGIDRLIVQALLETDDSISKIKKRLHLGSNGRIYNVGCRYLGAKFFEQRHAQAVKNRGFNLSDHEQVNQNLSSVDRATDDLVTLVHPKLDENKAEEVVSATKHDLNAQNKDTLSIIKANIRRHYFDLIGVKAEAQGWLNVVIPENSPAAKMSYEVLKADAGVILQGTNVQLEQLRELSQYIEPNVRNFTLRERVILCLELFSKLTGGEVIEIVDSVKKCSSTIYALIHKVLDCVLPTNFCKERKYRREKKQVALVSSALTTSKELKTNAESTDCVLQEQKSETAYVARDVARDLTCEQETSQALRSESDAKSKPMQISSPEPQAVLQAVKQMPPQIPTQQLSQSVLQTTLFNPPDKISSKQETLPLEIKLGGFTLSFSIPTTAEEAMVGMMNYVKERYHV